MDTVLSVLNTTVRAEPVVLLAEGGMFPQNVPMSGASTLGPL